MNEIKTQNSVKREIAEKECTANS